ncbi:MAG: hypothetical protein AUH85_10440 [Chloroflexi bacterium 13_1_40CM_4_68_4]|nr:MAG: hypothetical protein AUH85_10440 [Chloroflexi bacterium 13_1_40CM_4_68_4]
MAKSATSRSASRSGPAGSSSSAAKARPRKFPGTQEPAGGPGAQLLERVDHRQRQHASLEVLTDMLAEGLGVTGEVEHVVGDLEGEPELGAERSQPGDDLRIGVGEHRGALTARRVERCRLQLDAVHILALRRRARFGGDLVELAVTEREDRLCDERDDLGLGQHRGERVGLREQIVARDQGDLVAPRRVHRRHVPAYQGAVDDVVVHERRRVHELERLGQIDDDPRIRLRTETRRQEDKRRSQHLPRRVEEMRHGRGEDRMGAAADIAQPPPQLVQLVGDE